MRFVTDLSKGILGQPDSVELWERIVNQIPVAVLMKPCVTILNVAFGHGTEADVLVRRMVSLGRSAEEARAAIRLVDKYTPFVNFARLRGYTKVDKADFQKWAEEYHGMKFDIVIGNPPYQASVKESTKSGSSHSLWPLFVKIAIDLLEDDGLLVFVTPTDWRSVAVDGKRDTFEDLRSTVAMTTVRAVFTRVDESYFKLGQSIKIDAYILQKGKHHGQTYVHDTVTDAAGYIEQGGLVPHAVTSSLALSIIQKVALRGGDVLKIEVCSSSYGFTNSPSSIAALEKGGDYKYPAMTASQMIGSEKSKHRNGQWLKKKHPLHDTKKVMYTWNYGHFVLYDDGGVSPTNGIICIPVETERQGRAIADLLSSKLFRFMVNHLHKDGDMRLPKYIATFFPTIRSKMSAEALYAHFGLSADEIALVESTT